MKRRILALALALAAALSLAAVSALAGEETAPAGQSETEDAAGAETERSPAGPDDLANSTYTPDAVGVIRFENVERRMRENNLNLLALSETVAALEEMDYDELRQDMIDGLNQLADQQWVLMQMGQMDSFAYAQLSQAYDALRESFEDLKEGKLQADNNGVIHQLSNTRDQIVMAGESLYVMLAELEVQQAALQRQMAATNRMVEEMELRYRLGQISTLQLQQARAGQTALSSAMQTLGMNLETYKTNFELQLGAELTGKLRLGPLPEVTAAQLQAMDLERDLAAAKEKSYELYAADKTLADAKETYEDAAKEYHYNESDYNYTAAKHQWQAAQYTHDASVQDYEMRFRTLFAQVEDYRQIWEAAKVSLASQESSYAAAQLRHEQGNISENALADAADELATAQEAVTTAAGDLFSAYNSYCWAVQKGILNG